MKTVRRDREGAGIDGISTAVVVGDTGLITVATRARSHRRPAADRHAFSFYPLVAVCVFMVNGTA
jgi:hypothetical protein